mmetsp:Transcript_37004/g.60756  ORF Transcript_37004/g.60756 Transcript_37004/m.60756 type:complete len:234 (+) Transcript_37004:1-702(+)
MENRAVRIKLQLKLRKSANVRGSANVAKAVLVVNHEIGLALVPLAHREQSLFLVAAELVTVLQGALKFADRITVLMCRLLPIAMIKVPSGIENGLPIGSAFRAHAARLPGDTVAPTKAATAVAATAAPTTTTMATTMAATMATARPGTATPGRKPGTGRFLLRASEVRRVRCTRVGGRVADVGAKVGRGVLTLQCGPLSHIRHSHSTEGQEAQDATCEAHGVVLRNAPRATSR